MTVPPYACAFVVMFVVSWSSDRFRERGLHITALMVVGAICYALLATLGEEKLHAKYGLMVCLVAHRITITLPFSYPQRI